MNNASTHLVRSAIEELKQKKINNSNNSNNINKKPQPLSDKNTNSNNNNDISSKKPTPTAKACSQSGNKNGFSSYYFYLDNIGPQDKAKLTRRITLLGGNIEAFFSKKCTHVITSKHETTCSTNKVTDQENIPPCTKQKSQSDVVDKAKQWNIQVWGFDKAFDVMGKSIYNRQDKKKQLEKKVLGDVYQNDKRFGPSTGTKDLARLPQFVEFTGNYLIVEDATKVHRPPVIKEYTKQVLDKSHRHFPWPYLRNTPDNKSPFDKESEKEPEKNTTKKQENHHDNINKHDQQDEKQKIGENVAQNVACRPNTIHSTTTAHKNDNTNSNADTLPAREAPATLGRKMDSQMRASGLQPSLPNTQSGLNSIASQPKALVDNTRKPVLENLIRKVSHLSQQQEKEQRRQKDAKIELSRNQQQQRKEHDGFYCENCHVRFTHFKEHIKSESHQAFINNENHFKELDLLLEKTQRPLKILENKKRPSEFALDMTDIQAPYTKMLKHSPDIHHPPIHIEHGHSGQENWEKYHHVFLGNT